MYFYLFIFRQKAFGIDTLLCKYIYNYAFQKHWEEFTIKQPKSILPQILDPPVSDLL